MKTKDELQLEEDYTKINEEIDQLNEEAERIENALRALRFERNHGNS